MLLLKYYHEKKGYLNLKSTQECLGCLLAVLVYRLGGQGSKSDLWPGAWVHAPVVKGRLAFA